MVSKKCAGCGSYFSGELDGDYLCPACVAAGLAPRRPLSSLDELDAMDTPVMDTPGMDTAIEAPRHAPGSAAASSKRNVKGQAA